MVNAQANIGWVGDLLTPAAAGQVKLVLVGVGMMVLMIFRPQGILGSREEALIDER
jgi:branched-chain amino acid transport system permease protein